MFPAARLRVVQPRAVQSRHVHARAHIILVLFRRCNSVAKKQTTVRTVAGFRRGAAISPCSGVRRGTLVLSCRAPLAASLFPPVTKDFVTREVVKHTRLKRMPMPISH